MGGLTLWLKGWFRDSGILVDKKNVSAVFLMYLLISGKI
jgi:hypothetical protein